MTTSKGSQSAARMTIYTSLLVIDLSTSLTPFRTCFKGSSCCNISSIFLVNLGSAMGSALSTLSTILSFCYTFLASMISMKSSSSYLPIISLLI